MSNKFKFIKNLLENEKFNPTQKERFFKLVSRQLEKSSEFVDDVLGDAGKIKEEDIKEIKEKLKQIDAIKKDGDILKARISNLEQKINTKIENKSKIKIHNPKDMISYLFKFSSDEQYKWFTHKPDFNIEKIDYLDNLNKIKNLKKINNLNISTYKIIQNFLFNNTLYILHPPYKTKYTYSNEEVQKAITNGVNPFDLVIGDIYFRDIINRFKYAIEFRLDNEKYKFHSLFTDFITNNISIDFIENYTPDFKKNVKRLSTYIDVNNFFRGIQLIVEEWINLKKQLSTDIEIDLKDEEKFYMLTIFHRGSIIEHEFNSLKLEGLSGNLKQLRKLWFSIVDLKIESDLGSKENSEAYSIICLDENTTMNENYDLSKNKITKLRDSVGGVKYLIKIYKTKDI